MDSRTDPADHAPVPSAAVHPRLDKPLSDRQIIFGALAIALITAAAAVVQIFAFGTGTPADRAGLDSLRTAGTIALGAGGLAALYLAARRQQSTELDLQQKQKDLELRDRAQRHVEQVAADTQAHQLRVAEATEADAAARRVTDLYTAAAAQPGHLNAPVRLAGLYALERLAQDNPDQRQTIVNVLCAYLRMPFEPPPPLEKPVSEPTDFYDARQEREVRLTAQRILGAHLRKPGPNGEGDHHWPAMEINLSGAYLIDFTLDAVDAPLARFTKATFDGPASFWQSMFGGVDFEEAVFNGPADFAELRVRGDANFAKAEFERGADFHQVSILSLARFGGSQFADEALFRGAHLASSTFTDARFEGYASFDEVTFDFDPRLDGVHFAESPSFSDTTFGAHLARTEHVGTDSVAELGTDETGQ